MEAIVHSFDPFALQISGDFGIRWYGLAYLTGFVMGYFIIHKMSQRAMSPLSGERLADFVTFIAIGTMVGGRLGYCLFYSPDLFTRFTSTFPYWGVLAVNEGGMASHGGILGIIFVCIWYARKHKLDKLHLFDVCGLVGGIGIFCGRLANFVNGELYGREVKSALPWAVKFPQEIYTWLSGKTGELAKVETLKSVVPEIGVAPEKWSDWVSSYRFSSSSQFEIHSAVDKLILAVQSGNQKVIAGLAQVLPARHPSQIYEALLEGLFVFVVVNLAWLKPRKPGFIGALFVVTYAIVRIIGEQFRMPDAGIGFQLFGLTRGQWLSIAMVSAGFIFLFFMIKRKAELRPGWLSAEGAIPFSKEPAAAKGPKKKK